MGLKREGKCSVEAVLNTVKTILEVGGGLNVWNCSSKGGAYAWLVVAGLSVLVEHGKEFDDIRRRRIAESC